MRTSRSKAAILRGDGATVIFLTVDGVDAALLAVADRVKVTASAAS